MAFYKLTFYHLTFSQFDLLSPLTKYLLTFLHVDLISVDFLPFWLFVYWLFILSAFRLFDFWHFDFLRIYFITFLLFTFDIISVYLRSVYLLPLDFSSGTGQGASPSHQVKVTLLVSSVFFGGVLIEGGTEPKHHLPRFYFFSNFGHFIVKMSGTFFFKFQENGKVAKKWRIRLTVFGHFLAQVKNCFNGFL